MKKFLSMVTALCCTASMMAVLPASAEDYYQNYVVIAMSEPENPDVYVVSNLTGSTFWLYSGQMKPYTDETFSVGDIIEFHNIPSGATEKVGTNHLSIVPNTDRPDPSIKKIGSLLENPEIIEYNVTIESENLSKVPSYCILSNDTQISKRFWLDWGTGNFWQPDQYEYDFLQDGDTVSFYSFKGQPYIMINDSQEDTFHDYLYLGTDGENSILMDEHNQTYYLNTETLNSYLFRDFTPAFGMVLRFRNLLACPVNIPVEDVLSTFEIDLTPIEGKTPAIALHPETVDTWAKHATEFHVDSYTNEIVTLSQNGKQFDMRADFVTDTYKNTYEKYLLNHDEIANLETVSCVTWNGRPFLAVQEEAKDYLETAYVLGVDNPENPQQYFIKGNTKYSAIFTKEELAPYLKEDTTLKTGDILKLRNVSLEIGRDYHMIENYLDTSEGRPNQIEVSGSMSKDLSLKEFTFWAKNDHYVRVRDENNKDFDLYCIPEDFSTAFSPDVSNLKQGDKITCLTNGTTPVALYNAETSQMLDDCFLFAGFYGSRKVYMHCYTKNGYSSTEPVLLQTELNPDNFLTVNGTYTLDKENSLLNKMILSEESSFTDTQIAPEYQYMTVTKAEVFDVVTTENECLQIGIFELKDADGKTYEYSQNFTAFEWQLSLLNAKEGDIYQFSMYHDMPVTVTGTCPAPDIEPFMVVVGEIDGRPVGRYYNTIRTGLDTCDLAESRLMYLPEDYPSENVHYGDIFSVGDDYYFTNAKPSKIIWNDGGIFQKITDAYTAFHIEDLTIVSSSEKNQILTLQLKDTAGKEYTYIQDNSVSDLVYDYTGEFQTGDSMKFAVYGTTAFLPFKEKHDIYAEPEPNGDADQNGELDILDVITVNKVAMGKETISDEIIPYIDFNQNGKPDAGDALTMLKKIVGLA